jgi:light-regulated signal transduction histidine kinase (bacteriophytochrome)
MLLNARRVEPTDGVQHHILLAIEDITEREQSVAELRRLAESLARSNRELEQFASVTSHDLQEPLRVVVGFIDLLQRRLGEGLDATVKEYLSFIVDGAQQMQAMIRDLLEYSRLGKDQPEPAPVNLEDPLERALYNCRAGIEESGARVTHDPMPMVLGDRPQLTRLFQNLIGNAMKFRREATPEIHIGASEGGEGWLISVRDNGIGIDSRFAERLFSVFQRLHPRDRYPGTGIGLAICKKIVEQSGGRIWLESEVGKGTTFFFTLPGTGDAGKSNPQRSPE